MSDQKKKLKISSIQEDLTNGLDRKSIGAKYGLKPFEVKQLFQHPKLKGLRVREGVSFDLEDDTETQTQVEAFVPTPAKKAKPAAAAPKTAEAPSEGIKEVATEADAEEAASGDDATKSKKGMW